MKVEILQGNCKIFGSGLQKTKPHLMNHSTTDRNLYTDSVFTLFSDKAPNKTSQFLHTYKSLFFKKEKREIKIYYFNSPFHTRNISIKIDN